MQRAKNCGAHDMYAIEICRNIRKCRDGTDTKKIYHLDPDVVCLDGNRSDLLLLHRYYDRHLDFASFFALASFPVHKGWWYQ